MKDIRTQMKPIKIGKFTILVEKIRTVYDPKNHSTNYYTQLTKGGKFINSIGKEVYYGSEAKNMFFSKDLYHATLKDIEQSWRIELENLGLL